MQNVVSVTFLYRLGRASLKVALAVCMYVVCTEYEFSLNQCSEAS